MNIHIRSHTARTLVGGVAVAVGGVLLATVLGLGSATGGGAPSTSEDDPPAVVELADGSDIATVTLSARAAERLGIETTVVEDGAGSRLTVIPYGALIYDADGGTWTYTNPQPLVFERAPVDVDAIRGERVLLRDGPAVGTQVVTVGATELFGAEFGVGH